MCIRDRLIALGKDDLNAFLEVRARAPRIESFNLRHGVPVARLVTAALDRTLPVHRRVAALALLESSSFELSAEPATAIALVPLISDTERDVRLGVLAIHFSDGKTPPAFRDAIVRRFSSELDPKVRYALVVRARTEHILDRLQVGEAPIVYAERRGDVIVLAWTHPSTPGYAETVTLEARRTKGILRSGNLVDDRISSSASQFTASVTVPLTFSQRVEADTYDLSVEVTVKTSASKPPLFTQRLPLGPSALGPARPSPTAAPRH